ncbi:MAG: beta-N-acetylglucosaminidase domain-containing protein, partial [Bacteroidales bacterium]
DKVSPLFFVPTAYCLLHGTSTLAQIKNIDSDVIVAFTGNDVWSNISATDCQTMKNAIGRNPLLWWNNPCNDNHDDFLYMLDMTYRFSAQNAPITALGGVVSNPMQQGEASKGFMFGMADYCWNTSAFNAKNNWEAFFPEFIPSNKTLCDAFRTFCINVDPTKAPDILQNLYTSFKSTYSDHNLPEATTRSLISETGKVYDACSLIEKEWKNSKDGEYALMYEDINQWNGKLKSMCNIIKSGLTWMKNPGSLNNWTDYTNICREYKNLSTDPAFITFTLEGTGTSASIRYFDVKPAQQHMEPFVNYVMDKYRSYAPALPARTRTPEIIHNLKSLPDAAKLTTLDGVITLAGLSGVTLSTGEYIGVYINQLKETIINIPESSIPDEFDFEYSVNGKEWTVFSPDGKTKIEMAYFRIRNVSHGVSKAIRIENISTKMVVSGPVKLLSATTNLPQYSSYSVNNIINYNNNNFFWSSREQRTDDYIRVDMGDINGIYKIELLFDSNDQPTGNCVIEISPDASSWESIANFSAA